MRHHRVHARHRDHHHAGLRRRPFRRGRADAGLRTCHRPSRCALAGRHRHDGAAPGDGRHGSPPPAAERAGLRSRRHRIVVNTHLHADHRGGNHLFAGKPDPTSSAGSSTTRAARTATRSASGSRRPACGMCRSTASTSCCPGSDSSRHRATRPGMQTVVSERRAPGHRRRRRGGAVRRVRRAAHRRPAAGPCARPRAGLAHARARAMATPHRLRHHAQLRGVESVT